MMAGLTKVAVCGPNLNDQSKGQFDVHAAGCADLRGYGPGKRYGGEAPWELEVTSRAAVAEEIYADQIAENAGEDEAGYIATCLADFHFAPCCADLPVSRDEVEREPRPWHESLDPAQLCITAGPTTLRDPDTDEWRVELTYTFAGTEYQVGGEDATEKAAVLRLLDSLKTSIEARTV